jgi:hypothetical protein
MLLIIKVIKLIRVRPLKRIVKIKVLVQIIANIGPIE